MFGNRSFNLDTEGDEPIDVSKTDPEILNACFIDMRRKLRKLEKMEKKFEVYREECEAKLAQGKSEPTMFDHYDTSKLSDT